MAVGTCAGCGQRLPRLGRSDKKHCDGTCRMRAQRMRADQTPAKPRGPRQPMPRYQQGLTLLRVAAAFRQRAELAERETDELVKQITEQTLALAAAQQEKADLQRQLAELRSDLTPDSD